MSNKTTNKQVQFQYYEEDCRCAYCLFNTKKLEAQNSCGSEMCSFDDIRRDAIANGRVNRERGWSKCRGKQRAN